MSEREREGEGRTFPTNRFLLVCPSPALAGDEPPTLTPMPPAVTGREIASRPMASLGSGGGASSAKRAGVALDEPGMERGRGTDVGRESGCGTGIDIDTDIGAAPPPSSGLSSLTSRTLVCQV